MKIFDELFQSDRSAWLKILGCGLVSGFFAMGATNNSGAINVEVFGMVFFVIGVFMGTMLCLRDTVTKRIKEDRPVNLFLRMYLAKGAISLFLWSITLLGLTILFLFIEITFLL